MAERTLSEALGQWAVISIFVLAVAVIILMKAASSFGHDHSVSRCQSKIQKISNAIQSFRTTYGIYPPASGVAYVYARDCGPHGDQPCQHAPQYGLVSFLLPRARDGLCTNHPSTVLDAPEDLDALASWLYVLSDIRVASTVVELSDGEKVVSETFMDRWGYELVYACEEPYTNYTLSSVGKDGKPGTRDDVGGG